jgi:two-component system, OmpR family, sensor histidine kinase SenX3
VTVPGRKSRIFFIALGVCLIAAAVALNIGWIVLNWRMGILFIIGTLLFIAIIAGLVLNTIFLAREIRRNEQHDHFINAVTHELKTPVASIRLYLQTLQSRDIEEQKRHEFYDIMLADSDRLLHTIEQVLRVGRSGRWHARLNKTDLNLQDVVQECIDLARTRYHLGDDAVALAVALAHGDRPIVYGDIDEIRAAVSNLIDNAVKYSGSNVRVRVEIARTGEKRMAVRVTDEGVGIPKAELKQIFKRFYRIPGTVAMRVKGTGLGLFIVRSIAEKHGGEAFAESEGAGRGSTFTLVLPAGHRPA